MLQRWFGYLILLGFAVVMLVLLMLDDPAAEQVRFQAIQATESAQSFVLLFPAVSDPAQIYGINVRDVTSGDDILLMRDELGLWYAPAQEGDVNPALAEQADVAAAALIQMVGVQRFDATEENQEQFGLIPHPLYQFGFTIDPQGEYGYRVWIGDANPDNVAYYVWPETDTYIYLVPKALVDPVLTMLPSLFVPTIETEEPSSATEVAAPMP